jgi:hypothetical protein
VQQQHKTNRPKEATARARIAALVQFLARIQERPAE